MRVCAVVRYVFVHVSRLTITLPKSVVIGLPESSETRTGLKMGASGRGTALGRGGVTLSEVTSKGAGAGFKSGRGELGPGTGDSEGVKGVGGSAGDGTGRTGMGGRERMVWS